MTEVKFPSKVEREGLKFLKSNLAMIIFVGLFFVSFLTQSIMIGTGAWSGLSYRLLGTTATIESWLALVIPTIGSVLIVISVIYIARMDKKFVIYGVVGNVFLSLNGALSLLWFEAAKRAFFAVTYIVQYLHWGKTKDVKVQRIDFLSMMMSISIIVVMVGGLGTGFVFIPGSESWSALPYWDSLQTAFFVAGAILLVTKKAEAHIFYFIGDILAIAMFAYMGNWTLVITLSIFSLTTVPSYLSWNREARENNNEINIRI